MREEGDLENLNEDEKVPIVRIVLNMWKSRKGLLKFGK